MITKRRLVIGAGVALLAWNVLGSAPATLAQDFPGRTAINVQDAYPWNGDCSTIGAITAGMTLRTEGNGVGTAWRVTVRWEVLVNSPSGAYLSIPGMRQATGSSGITIYTLPADTTSPMYAFMPAGATRCYLHIFVDPTSTNTVGTFSVTNVVVRTYATGPGSGGGGNGGGTLPSASAAPNASGGTLATPSPTPTPTPPPAGADCPGTYFTIGSGSSSSAQSITIPTSGYAYVAYIGINITWAGESNENTMMKPNAGQTGATGPNGQYFDLASWTTAWGSGRSLTEVGRWDSPWWFPATGSTTSPGSLPSGQPRWGARNIGAYNGDIVLPLGVWANTTGHAVTMHMESGFGWPGYTFSACIVASATGPAAFPSPSPSATPTPTPTPSDPFAGRSADPTPMGPPGGGGGVDICNEHPGISACATWPPIPSGFDLCAAHPSVLACMTMPPASATADPSAGAAGFDAVFNHLMSKAPFGYVNQAVAAIGAAASAANAGNGPGGGGCTRGYACLDLPWFCAGCPEQNQVVQADVPIGEFATQAAPFRAVILALMIVLFAVAVLRWTQRTVGGGS